MTDSTESGTGSETRCPWCSSQVEANAQACPSCGAVLREPTAEDISIPGVTSLDPSTPTRRPIARPNRLVRLIAGDLDPLPPDATPASVAWLAPDAAALAAIGSAAVAPPSDAVRLEMARLELEALKAELEAQAAEVPAAAQGDAPA